MILVKRSYLYILAALFALVLIYGEVKFFYALESIDLHTDLSVKYEMENFIYAFIVLALVVYLFLFNVIRRSTRVLRRLDKMIELSEYGKLDVSAQLKQLGILGDRIGRLMHYFKNLSDIKSLKISSLSAINAMLVDKSDKRLFILNRHGNLVNCSGAFLSMLEADKKMIVKHNFDEIFKDMRYEGIFFDLERQRSSIVKDGIAIGIKDKAVKHRVAFYPIYNKEMNLSHIIGIVEE